MLVQRGGPLDQLVGAEGALPRVRPPVFSDLRSAGSILAMLRADFIGGISTVAFPDHEHVSIYDPARAEEFCRECGLVLMDKMPEQGPPAFRADDAGNLVGVQHGPAHAPGSGAMVGTTFWISRR